MTTPQSIELRGCKVSYLRKGQGDPLLFLHGARGGGVWVPFMERLSEQFDVIAPEHPGFGASDDPEWLDSMSDLAFFYLDLIEAFDLEDVHVVGNSLGGWLALEIAVRSTERVKSLCLLAPGGIYLNGKPPADIFLWSPQQLAENLFANPELTKAALAQTPTNDQIRAQLKNANTVAKLGWNPRFHNPDLRKWLHRVKVPTLIIWGQEDRINPVDYAPEFRKLIPNSRVSIIPQCGHLPHVEVMPEFIKQMTAFSQEIAR